MTTKVFDVAMTLKTRGNIKIPVFNVSGTVCISAKALPSIDPILVYV